MDNLAISTNPAIDRLVTGIKVALSTRVGDILLHIDLEKSIGTVSV